MKTTKKALTSSIVKKHKIGVFSDTSPKIVVVQALYILPEYRLKHMGYLQWPR